VTVRVNDEGKNLVVNAEFDLSGNTSLEVVLTDPAGNETVFTSSANNVTAPAVSVTVEVNGQDETFAANEYWQYPTEAGIIDVIGVWKIYGIYKDTGTTPDTALCGDVSSFTVVACGT